MLLDWGQCGIPRLVFPALRLYTSLLERLCSSSSFFFMHQARSWWFRWLLGRHNKIIPSSIRSYLAISFCPDSGSLIRFMVDLFTTGFNGI
jgi:hypothetical protein